MVREGSARRVVTVAEITYRVRRRDVAAVAAVVDAAAREPNLAAILLEHSFFKC